MARRHSARRTTGSGPARRNARRDDPAATLHERLLEDVGDGCVVVRNWRIVYVNRRLLELTGFRREDLLGRSFVKMLAPRRRHAIAREAYRRQAAGRRTPHRFEGFLLTKSGGEVPVELVCRRLRYRGETLVSYSAHDIRGRLSAAAERHRLADLQANMLRNANVAVVAVDRDGKVTLFNRAAERITGFSADEVVGSDRLWQMAFPDADTRERTLTTIFDLMRRGEDAKDLELPVHTRSGETRTLSWFTASLRDVNGRVIGGVGMGRDITDFRRAQAEAEVHRRRIEAFNAVVRSIMFADTIDDALKTVPALLREHLGADAVGLAFVHAPGLAGRVVADGNVPDAALAFVSRPSLPKRSDFHDVLETGRPVVIPDFRRHRRNRRVVAELMKAGWRSSVLLPVPGREHVLGVLMLACREAGRFDNDVEFLVTVAREIGLALEHGLLLAALEDRRRRVSAVSAVSRAIVTAESVTDALEHIPQIICDELRVDAVTLWVAGGVTGSGRFLFGGDVPRAAKRINREQGLEAAVWNRQVIETGRSVRIPDLAAEDDRPVIRAYRAAGFQSGVVVPVAGRQGVLGALGMIWRRRSFASHVLFETLGREIGLLIEHGLLVKQLDDRKRHVEAMNAVSRAVVLGATDANADDAAAIRRIPRILRQLTGANVASVLITETPDAPLLFVRDGRLPGVASGPATDREVPQARWHRHVLETGESVVLPDFRTDRRRPVVRALLKAGFRSGALLPLRDRGAVLGVLGLVWREPGYAGFDMEALSNLGEEIGLLLGHRRVIRQLENREQRVEVLHGVTRAAMLSDDVHKGLRDVPRLLRTLIDADTGLVFLPEADGQPPALIVDGSLPKSIRRAMLAPGVPQMHLTRRALRTGRPVVIKDRRRQAPSRRRGPGRSHRSIVVVPMAGRQRTVGTLEFSSVTPSRFTHADVAFLSTVGREIGLIVEQRLLERELADGERRLRALNAVTRAVMLSEALTEDIRRIPRVLRQLVGAEAAVLFVAERPGEAARPFFDGEVPAATRQALSRPSQPEARWTHHVMRTGKAVVISDMTRESLGRHAVSGVAESGFRSFVSVPVVGSRRIVGTLEFASKTPGAFTKRDVETLTTVGREVGLALDHRLTEEELADRERRLQALNAVTRAVVFAEHLEDGLQRIPRVLRRMTGADVSALLMSETAGVKTTTVIVGPVPAATRRVLTDPGAPGSALPAKVIRTGKPVLIEDFKAAGAADQVQPATLAAGFRSALVVPVPGTRGPIGVLACGSKAPGFFTERDTEMLSAVGREVGLAIEHRLLEDRLADREQRLEALSSQLLRARDDERHRVAAMLHDDVGQLVSLARLEVDLAGRRIDDPGQAAAEIDEAGRHLNQALGRVRSLAGELEPEILTDFNLIDALRRAVKSCNAAHDVSVTFRARGNAERLRPAVERGLFLIAMEAIQNALRHARAESIRVTLTFRPDGLTLSVRDDGRGMGPADAGSPAAGIGLRSMEDRAEQIGAVFTLQTARGKGTTVRVAVPLDKGESRP